MYKPIIIEHIFYVNVSDLPPNFHRHRDRQIQPQFGTGFHPYNATEMPITTRKRRSAIFDQIKIRVGSTSLTFALGLVLLLFLQMVVDLLPSETASNPYVGAWLRLWVFGIFAISTITLFKVKDEKLRGELFAVLIGLGLAGIVMLGLKNTSFSLNGISGDAGLLTAQVTKFAAFGGSVDFAYKDLPPFYPPLYLYSLGKTAALLGIEPYRMLKFGLIALVFVLPYLTHKFWFWVKPGLYSLAAVLSLLIFQDWYKPYEWITLVLFVPWWLHFVEGVGLKDERRGLYWFILGGLLGAALFSTYYYWFFIGGIGLVVRYLAERAGWAIADKNKHRWKSSILILGSTALFSLPYWGPLLASMWTTGGWTSLQNLYFLPDFNNLKLPFLDFSVTGAILLAGLVYLLVSFRRNTISRGLLVLLAGAYAWLILGYVVFILHSSLLTFKAREFVVYVLGLAAFLGALELTTTVCQQAALRRKWGGLMTGGAIVLALFFGQALAVGFSEHELLPQGLQTRHPQNLVSGYQAAISGEGLGHVILGDGGVVQLSVYLPVYQFLPWAAVYSHPAGLFYQRVDFLQQLARAENPHWFAAAVMNNRYSQIDEIILYPSEGGYILNYRPEQFPEQSVSEQIYFSEELFDPSYFSRKKLGPYVMFIPNYANDPMDEITRPENFDPIVDDSDLGDGDDFYEFLRRFEAHLNFPGQAEFWKKLSAVYGH